MGIFRKEWLVLGISCAAGAIVLHYTTKLIIRAIKDRDHPYVSVGSVSELYIYPLVSCRGRQVLHMNCVESGGSYGELKQGQFIVIDVNTGMVINALAHPRIVLIDCDISNDILTLTTSESTPIVVNLRQVTRLNIKTVYRLSETSGGVGLDCGAEAARWLSRTLQMVSPTKLIYCKDGITGTSHFLPNCLMPLSRNKILCNELTPYSLICKESLDDLNEAVETDMYASTRQFRPSIVISGCKPYEDEMWMEIKIGDAEFDCFALCERNEAVTIYPQIGEKDQDCELLKTLRKLRSSTTNTNSPSRKRNGNSAVTFGIKMRNIKKGTINTGDVVQVRYR